MLSPLKFLPGYRWQQAGQGRQYRVTNPWLICLAGTVATGRHGHIGSMYSFCLEPAFFLCSSLLSCTRPVQIPFRFSLKGNCLFIHTTLYSFPLLPSLLMTYLTMSWPSRTPLTWAPESGVYSPESHQIVSKQLNLQTFLFTSHLGHRNINTLKSLWPPCYI